jgi:hypothetical protein
MPVPIAISGNPLAYAQVSSDLVNVEGRRTIQPGRAPIPGVIKQRRFTNYIEVLEQGAHDPAIRTLAIQRGIDPRPMHRGRVNPLNGGQDPLTYYAPHGLIVAGLVSRFMTKKWTDNANPAATVFVPNAAQTLLTQGIIQPNGYSYEITMWYDTTDIYTAFHCYYR